MKFREGYHDYVIVTGGLRVFPRIIAAEHHAQFQREPVSSGIKGLDTLLGGGLDRGTTTLILGPAGTGKSTLALQYGVQMASRGQSSMFFAFDETRGVMLTRAKALGFDMETLIKSGLVTVQQVDPAELCPGEFATRIRRGVEAGCKLIVIDSLNGYLQSMPGEKYLNNQLHELSSYLNQQGVITILILAQHGLVAAAEAPVDLSYLSDTVVSLRYFEAHGEVRQALAVIKKRSGRHERTIRELKLITWQRTLGRRAAKGLPRYSYGRTCLLRRREANGEIWLRYGLKMDKAERVLIIAPVGDDAAAIAALLGDEGLVTRVCQGIEECTRQIIAASGALLLTEEALESPQLPDLLQILREQPTWSELPVIILTSGGESRRARLLDLAAAAAGTITLLERPISTRTLVRSVQVALRSRRRQYEVRDLLARTKELEPKPGAARS